jgi:hypothetical protein
MMSVAWGWLIAEQQSGRANHSREAEENSRQHHNVATIVREEDDRKMGLDGRSTRTGAGKRHLCSLFLVILWNITRPA